MTYHLWRFQFNFLYKNDFYTNKCIELLDMFDLAQNVSIATHQSATSLDKIITRYDDIILKNEPVACSLVSDHFAVKSEMNL